MSYCSRLDQPRNFYLNYRLLTILNKPHSADMYYGYISQEKGVECRCWSITIDSLRGWRGMRRISPIHGCSDWNKYLLILDIWLIKMRLRQIRCFVSFAYQIIHQHRFIKHQLNTGALYPSMFWGCRDETCCKELQDTVSAALSSLPVWKNLNNCLNIFLHLALIILWRWVENSKWVC